MKTLTLLPLLLLLILCRGSASVTWIQGDDEEKGRHFCDGRVSTFTTDSEERLGLGVGRSHQLPKWHPGCKQLRRKLGDNTATLPDGPVYPFHIRQINAHKLYKRGFYGQGVTVGISSTGWSPHEALLPSYRGYDPVTKTFDHNYNWLDSVGRGEVPVDSFQIGTFLAGMVSGLNTTLNYGVATQAKHIACKNTDGNGRETIESYILCLQWFWRHSISNGKTLIPPESPTLSTFRHVYPVARNRLSFVPQLRLCKRLVL